MLTNIPEGFLECSLSFVRHGDEVFFTRVSMAWMDDCATTPPVTLSEAKMNKKCKLVTLRFL